MSKRKGYTDITSDHINKVAEQFGWRSDITTNYIHAQLAVNLALVADCLIEIYGAERRRKIDEETELSKNAKQMLQKVSTLSGFQPDVT